MKYIIIIAILSLFVPIYVAETAQISVSIWRRAKAIQSISPLCRKEGPGWAYHNVTEQCHKISEPGPCDNLMKFSENLTSPGYGDCVCDFYRQCGRPVIQWPMTGKCYFVNDQGPCPQGQWLTLTPNRMPECTSNICQEQESETPSKGSKFWFSENGTCYQTNTKGYCNDEAALLLFTRLDYKPTCNYGLVCGAINVKDLPKIIKSWNLHTEPSSQNSTGQRVYKSVVDIQKQFTS